MLDLRIRSNERNGNPKIQIILDGETGTNYDYRTRGSSISETIGDTQWNVANLNDNKDVFYGKYKPVNPRTRPIIHGNGAARRLGAVLVSGALNTVTPVSTVTVKSTNDISEAYLYLYGRAENDSV